MMKLLSVLFLSFFAVGALWASSSQMNLNDDAYNSDVLEHAYFEFNSAPAYDDDVLEHAYYEFNSEPAYDDDVLEHAYYEFNSEPAYDDDVLEHA